MGERWSLIITSCGCSLEQPKVPVWPLESAPDRALSSLNGATLRSS